MSEYAVTHNITFTAPGNGRSALTFVRGFASATQPDIYFPAAAEWCETTQK
jgi:hypothetical protein